MKYYGLTEPKKFDVGFNDIEEIKKANCHFVEEFINVEDRRHIEGDFIFVKNYFKSGMYERFLHSVSMRNKEFYEVYPCNNDDTYIKCITKCEIFKSPPAIKELNRALCLYRLSRVVWIPEIIDLANNNNGNIKIWRKEEQDRTNKKWRWKRYVRYENGLADYILIFNEVYKEGKFSYLDFRTAYPVFIRRDKYKFSRDYERYKKTKK